MTEPSKVTRLRERVDVLSAERDMLRETLATELDRSRAREQGYERAIERLSERVVKYRKMMRADPPPPPVLKTIEHVPPKKLADSRDMWRTRALAAEWGLRNAERKLKNLQARTRRVLQ